MINQVLELSWNVGLLPSLIVKNQTKPQYHQPITTNQQHTALVIPAMQQKIHQTCISIRLIIITMCITLVSFCVPRGIVRYICAPTSSRIEQKFHTNKTLPANEWVMLIISDNYYLILSAKVSGIRVSERSTSSSLSYNVGHFEPKFEVVGNCNGHQQPFCALLDWQINILQLSSSTFHTR